MHYVRVNMLRADAEADDSGWDAAEEWKSGKQAGREWRLERFGFAQYTRDNPSFNHHLKPLGDSRGQFPSLLDAAQRIAGDFAFPERLEQSIACSYRVLNRQIDADPADGRHRVGGISDTQKPRPMPLR